MNKFKISQNGINLIKTQESCRLKAYQNTINGKKDRITIAYGHTGFLNGQELKLTDVITQQQAEELLKADLIVRENGINRLVTVKITQNQFDALMSLVYNIGLGDATHGFMGSTLLKDLNRGDFIGASKQFYVWNKVGATVCATLSRRRATEAMLFNK